MKRAELIKRISEEFGLDEIKVSEYFENIFESLAIAFIKNKNVNISEFGRFKVKSKKDEDDEKQKTVLFSPVKKFAYEINENFNDLSPIQIRLLNEKLLKDREPGIDYVEDEVEEIVLIDFGEEEKPETLETVPEKDLEETLIPEETGQEILHEEISAEEKQEKVQEETKEETLIPEETGQEILHEEITAKEKQEEIKEEILIPEDRVPADNGEIISIQVEAEIFKEETKENLPEVTEEISVPETNEELELIGKEQKRIFEELITVVIPGIEFSELEKEIELFELASADKKIISEATTIIKPEEKIPDVHEIEVEDKKEAEISEITEIVEEEKVDEILIPEISEEIVEEKKEEVLETPEIIEEEKKEEVLETPEIIEEEKKEEIPETSEVIEEEEIEETVSPEIPEEIEEAKNEEETKEETESVEETDKIYKSNLELEAELLKMLDERKRILDEIKKLENIEQEDLLDISESKAVSPDKEQDLFEEDTLDKPKQNIFIDENGKILDNLLQNFKSEQELTEEEESKEEQQISESAGEKGDEPESEGVIPKAEDDIEEKAEEIKEEQTGEKIKEEELDNLFSSIYGEQENKTEPVNTSDNDFSLKSQEMQIFDKLLDEKNEDKIPVTGDEIPELSDDELESFNKPENIFVNFKTQKTEDSQPETVVGKTKPGDKDTIKTYDDIFSLLEPNGKKKEKAPEKIIEKKQEKKYPPILKLVIPIVIILILIIISVILYRSSVYRPPEENTQNQVAPLDTTGTQLRDSIIYADTNKMEDAIEEEIVYDDESGFIVKHNENGFFVQFGNYENQFELAKKIKELKEKNIFPTFTKDTTEGTLVYKLRIGPYKSLEEAKSVIPQL